MSNTFDLFSQTRGMASIAALFFFVCTASAQAPATRRPTTTTTTTIETRPAVIAPGPVGTEPQQPDADGMRRKICRDRSDFDCFFFLHQRLAEKMNALEQRVNQLVSAGSTTPPPADLDARLAAIEQRLNDLANRPTPSSNLNEIAANLQAQINSLRRDLTRRPTGGPRPPAGGDGKADSWDDLNRRLDEINTKLKRARVTGF